MMRILLWVLAVVALAVAPAWGQVRVGPLQAQNNLADLASPATALSNLTGSQPASTVLAAPSGAAGVPVFRALTPGDLSGLGGLATLGAGTGLTTGSGLLSVTFGTTAGTAAAGNDSRIIGALQTTGGSISGGLSVAGQAVVDAATAHNEIVSTTGQTTARGTTLYDPDGAFTSAMATGHQTIILDGLGASGADLITTVSAVTDGQHLTFAAPTDATYGTAPWWTIGRAWLASTATVTASYRINDTVTPTGGTFSTAGVFTTDSLGVNNLVVANGGSGGTNGTGCVFQGTTGVTRSWFSNGGTVTTAANSYFTFSGTVSGGALTSVSLVHPGDYSTAPYAASLGGVATAPTSTVTFTSASAVIGWTSNPLMAGEPVQLTNSGGALPTNFAASTTYYVSATGLTSSQFELAATATGTPIVAGSAGSGTQTATVVEPIKLISGACTAPANATVSFFMAPRYLVQTTPGLYTALPTNTTTTPTTTSGSGAGATLVLWGYFPTGEASNTTVPGDQVGGRYEIGTPDDAAIATAVASLEALGGGRLVLPAGQSLLLNAWPQTWTGSTTPQQPPIIIQGAGRIITQSGVGGYISLYTATLAGTLLDMHYAGGDAAGDTAKIDTRGFGQLGIKGVTLADYGTDNYLFLQDSNTSVNFKAVTFSGNPSCFRMTCVQAAMQFGGISGTAGTYASAQPNAPYQGYNSHLTDVDYGHLAQGIRFGDSANNIHIDGGNADATNGTYSTTTFFYHLYGFDNGNSDNTVVGGNIEASGFPYIVGSTSAGGGQSDNNVFMNGPQCSDTSGDEENEGHIYGHFGGPSLGCFYFDANASRNSVVAAAVDNGVSGNFIVQAGTYPNNSFYLDYSAVPTVLASGLILPRGNSNANSTTFLLDTPAYGYVPPYPHVIGDGTTNEILAINGPSSGNAAGGGLYFLNGNSGCAYVGTHSLVLGGVYNSGLVIGANCTDIEMEYQGSTKLTLNGSGVTMSSNLILARSTVASLPTCNSATSGDTYFATDLTSPTYGGTLTGGGAVGRPVSCDGSAWHS